LPFRRGERPWVEEVAAGRALAVQVSRVGGGAANKWDHVERVEIPPSSRPATQSGDRTDRGRRARIKQRTADRNISPNGSSPDAIRARRSDKWILFGPRTACCRCFPRPIAPRLLSAASLTYLGKTRRAEHHAHAEAGPGRGTVQKPAALMRLRGRLRIALQGKGGSVRFGIETSSPTRPCRNGTPGAYVLWRRS